MKRSITINAKTILLSIVCILMAVVQINITANVIPEDASQVDLRQQSMVQNIVDHSDIKITIDRLDTSRVYYNLEMKVIINDDTWKEIISHNPVVFEFPSNTKIVENHSNFKNVHIIDHGFELKLSEAEVKPENVEINFLLVTELKDILDQEIDLNLFPLYSVINNYLSKMNIDMSDLQKVEGPNAKNPPMETNLNQLLNNDAKIKKVATHNDDYYSLNDGHYYHAIQWDVYLNLDTQALEDEGMLNIKIEETYLYTFLDYNYNVDNSMLYFEMLRDYDLKAFTKDAEGNLVASPQNDVIIDMQNDVVLYSTPDIMYFSITKDVNPEYIYKWSYTTLITFSDARPEGYVNEENESALNGIFKTDSNYIETYVSTGRSTNDTLETFFKLDPQNQMLLTGEVNEPNENGYQEIEWTLRLNQIRDQIFDVSIKVELDDKLSFNPLMSTDTFTQYHDNLTMPAFEKFKMFQRENGAFYQLFDYQYEIRNLDGEIKSLDNLITGKSGFEIKLNYRPLDELYATFSTYTQVLSTDDFPIGLNAKHDYSYYSQYKPKRNNLEVKNSVSFDLGNHIGNYGSDLNTLNIYLNYDENKVHPSNQNKGSRITGSTLENSIIALYRFEENNLQNHTIYRMGTLNVNGQVSFENVESGMYIVKQYLTSEDYYIPDELAVAMDETPSSNDKSVSISNINKDHLVYIEVNNSNGNSNNYTDAWIYNLTPRLNMDYQGVLYAEDNEIIESITNKGLKIRKKDDSWETNVISNNRGKVILGDGTANSHRIGFGTYEISQTAPYASGYLKNSEIKLIVLDKNENGSFKYLEDNNIFNIYKTRVIINNILFKQGGISDNRFISNSKFQLEKKISGSWTKVFDDEFFSPNFDPTTHTFENSAGIINIYNLDVGEYRLRQVVSGFIDDQKVHLNKEPKEFTVYTKDGLSTDVYEGKPTPLEIFFENEQNLVTIQNILNGSNISGNKFVISDFNDVVIEEFEILESNGYTTSLPQGQYKLTQKSTINSLPRNLNTVIFDVIKTDDDSNSDKALVVFNNHTGSIKVKGYSNIASLDISQFTLSKNKLVQGQYESMNLDNLYSGKYELSNILIDKNYILINKDYETVIPDQYENIEDLDSVISVYATQAVIPIDIFNGDTSILLNRSDSEMSLLKDGAIYKTNDQLEFNLVGPGTYQLRQDKAPAGYGLNLDKIENINIPFSVDESSVTIDKIHHVVSSVPLDRLQFKNYQGKVELISDTSNNKRDVNLRFDLHLNDQIVYSNLQFNESGVIAVDHLEPGSYYFKEIKSQENSKDINIYKFVVSDSNHGSYDIIKIHMDGNDHQLPGTGYTNTMNIYGTILLFTGMILLRKKEKVNTRN